jgi:hypothetical protein
MGSTAIGREASRVASYGDGRAGPDREHARRGPFSGRVVATFASPPHPHIALRRTPTHGNIYGTYVGVCGGVCTVRRLLLDWDAERPLGRMEGQCETRCGVSAAYRVTTVKTATTDGWREVRGAACVAHAPSFSGHLCKPPRPLKPRVGFRTAPGRPPRSSYPRVVFPRAPVDHGTQSASRNVL